MNFNHSVFLFNFGTKKNSEKQHTGSSRTPHSHWRRQLWGTGARAPLDFQLVILGITRCTDSDESCARFSENVGLQKQRDFCAIFLNQFLPHFCHFFCPQFSSGSNYSSQNAGTIANKFQHHTYFRFR